MKIKVMFMVVAAMGAFAFHLSALEGQFVPSFDQSYVSADYVLATGNLLDGNGQTATAPTANSGQGSAAGDAVSFVFVNQDNSQGAIAGAFAVGDVNRDGAVDFLDIAPFITILSEGRFQVEADINL